jgi:hypothetical protein
VSSMKPHLIVKCFGLVCMLRVNAFNETVYVCCDCRMNVLAVLTLRCQVKDMVCGPWGKGCRLEGQRV